MHKRLKVIGLGLGLIFSLLPISVVRAEGTASFTVESDSTVSAGASLELRFYVTPSGADLGAGNVSVALSNLAYQSFDATGTAFNGFAGVTSGGSACSTSFEIAASYNDNGGSGKLYIGKVVAQAGSSAGAGQVNLSNAKAYESPTSAAMSASSANQTITISTTEQTTATPNCSSDAASSSANPTTSPNPNSNVALADSDATAETPPTIVSEQVLSDSFATQNQGSTSDIEKKDTSNKGLIIGGVLLGGLVALAAMMVIRKRQYAGSTLNDTPTNTVKSKSQSKPDSETTVINPADQPTENSQPEKGSDENKKV